MAGVPVRFIEVVDVTRLTPRMVRVRFGGAELEGFVLPQEPDQQVKLCFPRPGQSTPVLPRPEAGADGDTMRWYQAFLAVPDDERPWMRSYTLRRHDAQRGAVDIDFVLHGEDDGEAGPATRWARSAKPGDVLGMFGPSPDFARRVPLSSSIAAADHVVLAGDETALPAIATLLESLPDGKRATVWIEVAGVAEEQPLLSNGEATVHWLHRGEAAFLDAVRAAPFPEGEVFTWVAGEAGTVRALRRYLVEERGMDKRSVDFAGYWRRRLSQDDAPTEEDLAEAQERLAEGR